MDESVCDGLPIIRVKRDGSRIFDPQAKSRLVEACLQPGVSIASLALSHGVNANLLHKWIRRDRRAREKGVMKDGAEKLSAFVPVIQNKSAPAIRERPACMPALSQSTRKWPDPAKPSRLNAYLPNGVRLTLECPGQDAEVVWPLICKCICTVRLWIFAKALMGSLRWLSKVCNGIHLRARFTHSAIAGGIA